MDFRALLYMDFLYLIISVLSFHVTHIMATSSQIPYRIELRLL